MTIFKDNVVTGNRYRSILYSIYKRDDRHFYYTLVPSQDFPWDSDSILLTEPKYSSAFGFVSPELAEAQARGMIDRICDICLMLNKGEYRLEGKKRVA
jgi:hypothetical protein